MNKLVVFSIDMVSSPFSVVARKCDKLSDVGPVTNQTALLIAAIDFIDVTSTQVCNISSSAGFATAQRHQVDASVVCVDCRCCLSAVVSLHTLNLRNCLLCSTNLLD